MTLTIPTSPSHSPISISSQRIISASSIRPTSSRRLSPLTQSILVLRSFLSVAQLFPKSKMLQSFLRRLISVLKTVLDFSYFLLLRRLPSAYWLKGNPIISYIVSKLNLLTDYIVQHPPTRANIIKHLTTVTPPQTPTPNTFKSQSLLEYSLRQLPKTAKLSIFTLIAGILTQGITKIAGGDPAFTSPVLSTIAQLTGLRALTTMVYHISSNLGITQVVSPSFLSLSTLGSFIYSMSQYFMLITSKILKSSSKTNLTTFPFTVKQINLIKTRFTDAFFNHHTMTKFYLGFNIIYTAFYSYSALLSRNYNAGIRPYRPLGKMRRGPNYFALGLYFSSLSFTFFHWLKESYRLLTKPNISLFFSFFGFALSAMGSLEAGLRASLTSIPQITPYQAAASLSTAYCLAALSLVPFLKHSGTSRVYSTGYLTMFTSMAINAYFCAKHEKSLANWPRPFPLPSKSSISGSGASSSQL